MLDLRQSEMYGNAVMAAIGTGPDGDIPAGAPKGRSGLVIEWQGFGSAKKTES